MRLTEGVSYFVSPHSANLTLFRCEPYAATLSTKGCASRWIEAQGAAGECADRFAACKGCPIGAGHAGHVAVSYGRYFGTMICPRCREGRGRMIGGTRCVGCYNREREAASGKNARGNVPVKILAERVLRTFELNVIVGGEVRAVRAGNVVDRFEAMMQIMRTTPGVIEFAFRGPTLPGNRNLVAGDADVNGRQTSTATDAVQWTVGATGLSRTVTGCHLDVSLSPKC
jgi:hypothetical protein